MILGIVTARLGSTRLPAKALLPMADTTMVGHIFNVVLDSEVDQVVLCTPDEFLKDFVEGDCKVWKGNRDIIGELFYAALKYGADHIVRVTADCPFITSDIINKVLSEHTTSDAEYTYNHHDILKSNTKEGIDVEVISFGALTYLHKTSSEREHLCTSKLDLKVRRVDMEEERDVFSVNTLEEYVKAYKEV